MTRPFRSLIAFCMLVGSISAFSGSSVSADPRPIHEDILPLEAALDLVVLDLEVFATDVIAGNYGNGADRIERLTRVGLGEHIEAVQEIVNKNVPKVTSPARATATATRLDPPTPTPPPSSGGVWTGPRPAYYGGGSGCSQANANLIANAMWNVGAQNWAVEQMLGIVSRESNCNSAAHNGNRRTGDDSWGFCQLNVLAGFFRSGQILSAYNPYSFAGNPSHNAAACAKLYSVCGFGPWIKGDYGCRRP
jgi:hypothetical protein